VIFSPLLPEKTPFPEELVVSKLRQMEELTLEFLDVFTRIWLLHVVAAVVLASPFIVAGWKRARFEWWEISVLFVPYAIWMGCMVMNGQGKSLANLGEPIYLCPAIAVAALIRALVGRRVDPKRVSQTLLGLLCVTSFCIYWFTPCWPE